MNGASSRSLLGAIALLLAAGPAAAADIGLDDAALLARLRGGGLTLYFRHAQTNWSESDRVRQAEDVTSCDPSRMRQLSDTGRDTARQVGNAIRALAIPVAQVMASPYCRTVETAQLMALGPVRTTEAVMNMLEADRFGGRAAIVSSARKLFATPPPAAGNTVIVAHGNVARDATPAYPDEAEGVVFEADGRGGFSVVALIPPERWALLLALE